MKKKNKLKNIINNENILDNTFNNFLSTNFYQYYQYEIREGIEKFLKKL